jgi:hypothetical protein
MATPFVSSFTTHAEANKSLFWLFLLLSLDRMMPRYRDNPEFTLVYAASAPPGGERKVSSDICAVVGRLGNKCLHNQHPGSIRPKLYL